MSTKETAANIQKNPDDWVSGNEPMTDAQASYLQTLSEQARQPFTVGKDLTKAEASKLIDERRRASSRSKRAILIKGGRDATRRQTKLHRQAEATGRAH